MTTLDTLHQQWMKDPDYAREYAALEPEFKIAAALIDARTKAGLTQQELANRMSTKQAFIARLEGGNQNTTIKTLERLAEATGLQLTIRFDPIPASTAPTPHPAP
jgi:transcriptional regulator with XRE-family HTH domain